MNHDKCVGIGHAVDVNSNLAVLSAVCTAEWTERCSERREGEGRKVEAKTFFSPLFGYPFSVAHMKEGSRRIGFGRQNGREKGLRFQLDRG